MKNFTTSLAVFFISCLIPNFATGQNKICLVMAVKNDASVVKDCLESTRGIVDYISICDLGCTDQTIEKIEAFAQESQISLCITPSVWNQNESPTSLAVSAAKQFLSNLQEPLAETYLLIVKPDSICRVGSDFQKEKLTDDLYAIRCASPILSYFSYPISLIRASCSEQLNSKERTSRLQSLHLDGNEHPEYKSRKTEREAVRLTKESNKNPNDPHLLFELAGIHCALQNYDRMLELYQKRISLPEIGDEVWLSKYRLGEYFETRCLWPEAQYWYLEAYRQDPTRTEPLKKIATHYRFLGINDLGTLFALQGHLTSLDEHTLYPIPSIAEYEIDHELSITAFYTPQKEEGFLAADRLILKRDVPWFIKNQAYQNVLFYVQPIKSRTHFPIKIDCPFINEQTQQRFFPTNPSIVKTDSGYEVICRTVNYTQVGAKYYDVHDPKGIVRTRNFLLKYDPCFFLLSQEEIIEILPRHREESVYHVTGLEDCRLFYWNQSPWFTCTTMDVSLYRVPKISLCKLSEQGLRGKRHVEALIPLQGPEPARCEKNWLPFVKDGDLHLIYCYEPFTIYKPDLETGHSTTLFSGSDQNDYSNFRGSAPPIPWKDGYLFLIHEVVQKQDLTRTMLHRLVFFDQQFQIKRLSLPFIFDHLGIEYCCGFALDHSNTQLIFAVGLEDKEAHLYFVDCTEIEMMLDQ